MRILLVVWMVVLGAGRAVAEAPDAVAKKIVAAQVAALTDKVDNEVLAKTFGRSAASAGRPARSSSNRGSR